MISVNYDQLKQDIIGKDVPMHPSGTLSGHAAGEPFDKLVYENIKSKFPNNTFRQYEYLNYLYSNNTDKVGTQARQSLFDSPTVMFLLSRGKKVTDDWSVDNLFEEKQNDTADMLVTDNGLFDIIDIKTRNLSKKAQPPNIISSFKLAQVCAKMIDNSEFEAFTINYFEVGWLLKGDRLVCQDTYVANLFKANPCELYINWAAAMQVQFQVSGLDQSFNGTMEEWAREYLKHFVMHARRRSNDMIKKFVTPFEKYLIN